MPHKTSQANSFKLWPWPGLLVLLIGAGLLLFWMTRTMQGSGQHIAPAQAALSDASPATSQTDAMNLHAYAPEPRPRWAKQAYPMLDAKAQQTGEAKLWPVSDALKRITASERVARKNAKDFDQSGAQTRLTGAFLVQSWQRKQALLLLFETPDSPMDCHACSPWQSAFEYEHVQGEWKLLRAHVAFDRIGSWGKTAPYLVLPHPRHGYVVTYDYAYMAQGQSSKWWVEYSPRGGVMQPTGSRPSVTHHSDDPV